MEENLLLFVVAYSEGYSEIEAKQRLKTLFQAYKKLLKSLPEFNKFNPVWSEREFISPGILSDYCRYGFELRFESIDLLNKRERERLTSIVQEFANAHDLTMYTLEELSRKNTQS